LKNSMPVRLTWQQRQTEWGMELEIGQRRLKRLEAIKVLARMTK